MELISDDGSSSPVNKRTEMAKALANAVAHERNYQGEAKLKPISLSVLEPAAEYCIKNNVKPVFLVRAIAWANSGRKWSAGLFTFKACMTAWESFLKNRVPDDLPVDLSDLESPLSIDVFMECEMAARMIKDKYHTTNKGEMFKLGACDPCFELLPVTRLILSDMSKVALDYYGKEYLEWCTRSPVCAMVLNDFGYDSKQVDEFLRIK